MWRLPVFASSYGASPSGAKRLRRVPGMPPLSRARYGVTSCRRRWHKCRSRCEAPDGAIARWLRQPKWPNDTARILPFPIGASVAAEAASAGAARDGWSVPVAGVAPFDIVVTGEDAEALLTVERNHKPATLSLWKPVMKGSFGAFTRCFAAIVILYAPAATAQEQCIRGV